MRKIYMARKVSLIVIWPSFENKMVVILRRPYIPLIIVTRGSKCENNFKEVNASDSFPIADFYL